VHSASGPKKQLKSFGIQEGVMAKKSNVQEVKNVKMDKIIEKYKGKEGGLLGILEETQAMIEHKYLTEDALAYISQKTGVPLSQIYGVITFYALFNLKPQGEHTITVCRGTACHTKGSKALLEELGLLLGGYKELEGGDVSFTTPDSFYTIRTVACFGQCALSPVIAVDETIHSNATLAKSKKIIAKLSCGRK
jgi:NADH-quinone oxidoreductase subunit E